LCDKSFFFVSIIDVTLALTKIISFGSKWLCESARWLHFNEVVESNQKISR